MAITASTYLTLATSVDRYAAVCHPFGWAARESRRLSRAMIMAVGIFAVAFNVPHFFAYERVRTYSLVQKNGVTTNVSRIALRASEFRRSKPYKLWYMTVAQFAVNFAVPIVAMAVLNVKISVRAFFADFSSVGFGRPGHVERQ